MWMHVYGQDVAVMLLFVEEDELRLEAHFRQKMGSGIGFVR